MLGQVAKTLTLKDSGLPSNLPDPDTTVIVALRVSVRR